MGRVLVRLLVARLPGGEVTGNHGNLMAFPLKNEHHDDDDDDDETN